MYRVSVVLAISNFLLYSHFVRYYRQNCLLEQLDASRDLSAIAIVEEEMGFAMSAQYEAKRTGSLKASLIPRNKKDII